MKTKKTVQAGRSSSREEWIYGLNPVLEALKSGRQVKSIFLSSSRREKIYDIEKEAAALGIQIRLVDPLFLDKMFFKGHQGIAAIAAPRKYHDIEMLIALPMKKDQIPLFLILDCLEDPRNFGAVLRVADAGGVHGVVIQSHRSVSLTPEANKASAGASEYMPIAMVPNIKHAFREMKEKGITVVGAEAGAEKTIWDVNLRVPLAVTIGSEGKGLRKTVKDDCDMLVSLPMMGMVNSLNASVAAGIIIFEIMRQRMRNN